MAITACRLVMVLSALSVIGTDKGVPRHRYQQNNQAMKSLALFAKLGVLDPIFRVWCTSVLSNKRFLSAARIINIRVPAVLITPLAFLFYESNAQHSDRVTFRAGTLISIINP